MAYKATIIPIMIATPGDVSEEREIIRSVIHDWNDVNAATAKIMLSPIGWETHSSPELGARPQELINSRVLKECDLLVGVFWTRLGTPTGKSASGTVEEIEEHLKAGKPAMIYFSSAPVAPQSIDAVQFNEVQIFKEKCKGLGLIEQYENLEQFKGKLSKQLQVCLNQNDYLKNIIKPKIKVTTTESSINPEQENTYNLSPDAKELLKAAASNEDGTILKAEYIGGRHVQAGDKQFGGSNARESAKWETALNQLIIRGLVVARGYKGQVFELTHRGWSVADNL